MASRLWEGVSKAVFGSSSSSGGGGGIIGNNNNNNKEAGKDITAQSQSPLSSSTPSSSSSTSPSSSTSLFTTAVMDLSTNLDSYWNYVESTVQYATESTYLTVASIVSPFYDSSFPSNDDDYDYDNTKKAITSHNNTYNDVKTMIDSRNREQRTCNTSSFLLRMAANRRYATTAPTSATATATTPATTTTTTTDPSHRSTSLSSQQHHHHHHHHHRVLSWDVITKNPYNVVRGRQPFHHKKQSISAVRSFLALVPVEEDRHDDRHDDAPSKQHHPYQHRQREQQQQQQPREEDDGTATEDHVDENFVEDVTGTRATSKATASGPHGQHFHSRSDTAAASDPLLSPLGGTQQQQQHHSYNHPRVVRSYADSDHNNNNNSNNHQRAQKNKNRDELASQVAEGTLRALRDIALEEALELNAALRFWSHRWERPLLSWWEAGPVIWWTRSSPTGGYRHFVVGERVAQLQAVLARRCAAIGELQEHLLRAGWQQGVAQWGVLDQFQTVSGVDGSIKKQRQQQQQQQQQHRHHQLQEQQQQQRTNVNVVPQPPQPMLNPPSRLSMPNKEELEDSQQSSSSSPRLPPRPPPPQPFTSMQSGSSIDERSVSHHSYRSRSFRRQSSHVGSGVADNTANDMTGITQQPTSAHVLVKRGDGEGLYTDHPAFVAEWAVEAIALVRSHLYRASNGMVKLPYEEHWVADLEDDPSKIIPVWVSRVYHPIDSNHNNHSDNEAAVCTSLRVTDLNLMMTEVSELLNAMEDIMTLQRQRRLERMKPPGWLRRNWYVSATVGPAILWLLWTGSIRSIVTNTLSRIRTFVHERFTERFMAM